MVDGQSPSPTAASAAAPVAVASTAPRSTGTPAASAAAEAEPFPSSLREAVDSWEQSELARRVFGDAVWKHYLNYGRTEQRLFDEVVTDYERARMFERG